VFFFKVSLLLLELSQKIFYHLLCEVVGLICINGENLKLNDVVKVARYREKVALDDEARIKVKKSRETIEKLLRTGKVIYGVNTGFGALVNKRISKEDLLALQRNIVLSHSAGVGKALEEEIVRAIMLLRANSLAKGFSGVRVEVIEKLLEFLNEDITPYVPEMGSVGASGDLAPLSHIALSLIGEGYVLCEDGRVQTKEVLKHKGIKPIVLEEKEGLSLVNGTQAMTAILALVVHDAKNLMKVATLISAISIDALLGSSQPFDPRIHMVRPYNGQKKIAEFLFNCLEKSEIRNSHRGCSKVQDAYSLRTIPQVYGAVLDTLDYAEKILEIEMNSATDNPLVFDEDVISGGNFHGEPIALVCDYLAIALTDMGNMIERRIDRLVNPLVNADLPPFLAEGKEGLNSGYMLWQYTAAAICNENKVLSHPASSDTIPTSALQEDHVSMGMNAARKLKKIFENLITLVAIEAMLASVAIRKRRPLKSCDEVEIMVDEINNVLGKGSDRFVLDEFERVRDIIISEIKKI